MYLASFPARLSFDPLRLRSDSFAGIPIPFLPTPPNKGFFRSMAAPVSVVRRIAIFGASGQTGKFLTQQALERGLGLNILVRDPTKLPDALKQDNRVAVIKGDVTNADDVFRTIVYGATDEEQAAGVKRPADAVLSCLGTQTLRGPPAQCHSLGTRNMISAMQSPGSPAKKLVVMSAVGVGESAKEVPFWAWPASYLANNYILNEVQADKAIMEKEIMESGLGGFETFPRAFSPDPVVLIP